MSPQPHRAVAHTPDSSAHPTPDDRSTPGARLAVPLLVTLALLTAIAPFATDLYLPAFPSMVSDLATSSSGVQLSLTAFLIGAGAGQLVFGPLSDRFGRRTPLFMGVVMFLLASIGAAIAPTIGVLVAFRLLQGLSGAAGMVIARAIISDKASGDEAARAHTLMMLVGGIAPVIAPMLGATLADAIGWRGLLGVVALIGAVAVVASFATVRETRPRPPRHEREPFTNELRAGVRALRSRRYAGHATAFAFAFATMMAYISASPFLYQGLMGLSTMQYGLAFGLNALLLMVVSGVAAKITGRVHSGLLARIGLRVNLGAIATLTVAALVGVPAGWLAVPLAVAIASLGMVFGTVTALALDAAPEAPGMASAVLGMGQFALAGVVAPLVGIGGESTVLPLAVVMLVAAVIANVALRIARRPA